MLENIRTQIHEYRSDHMGDADLAVFAPPKAADTIRNQCDVFVPGDSTPSVYGADLVIDRGVDEPVVLPADIADLRPDERCRTAVPDTYLRQLIDRTGITRRGGGTHRVVPLYRHRATETEAADWTEPVLSPDQLNDTDEQLLDVLAEGRVTPTYAAEQIDVSREYASDRLKRLTEHAHVEKVAPGLYELVDDPRNPPELADEHAERVRESEAAFERGDATDLEDTDG